MNANQKAFRVMLRSLSHGENSLIHPILNHRQLFADGDLPSSERHLIQALGNVVHLCPGGDFEELTEQLIEHDLEAAELFSELAFSAGSSDPTLFWRYFEEAQAPFVADKLAQVSERISHSGLSVCDAWREVERIRPELNGSLPAQKEEDGVFFIGDSDLEPEYEENVPDIIQGLLKGGTAIAAGMRKKSFKTTFLMAALMHVQCGKSFLGREVRQMNVGIVNKDMPQNLFIDYNRQIRTGMELGNLSPPIACYDQAIDIARTEGQDLLVKMVQKYEIKLLLLDSLRGVSSANEDKAQDAGKVIRRFLNNVLRDELGCDPILVAHPSRGDSVVAGSWDWEGAADSILKFSPHIVDGVVQYVSIFGEGRHEDFRLNFIVENLRAEGCGCLVREIEESERRGLKGDEHDSETSKCPQDVPYHLAVNGASTLQDILEAYPEHSLEAFKRDLRKGEKDGRYVCLGKKERSNALLWSLAKNQNRPES